MKRKFNWRILRTVFLAVFFAACAIGGMMDHLGSREIRVIYAGEGGERAVGTEGSERSAPDVTSVSVGANSEIEQGEQAQTEPASAQRSHYDASGRLDLNAATAEELQTVSGIGPAKAEAILRYREEYGGFSSLEELTEVSGIGEKTLEKIRGCFYIDAAEPYKNR